MYLCVFVSENVKAIMYVCVCVCHANKCVALCSFLSQDGSAEERWVHHTCVHKSKLSAA